MRTSVAFILVVLLCGSVPQFASGAETGRRNVVLLIGDDTGLDLGCYGAKVRTPNLDGLARRGSRFTHAFATVSSCSPSRAVLFTGLYTHSNGQYGLAHAAHNAHTLTSVKSLPARLKQAGYRTGIIGKLHVLPKEVYPWDEEIGPAVARTRDVTAFGEFVEKFVAKDAEKPFLLVVGFADTHRAAKGFGNQEPGAELESEQYKPEDVTVPAFLPDQKEVRHELAEYYQSVSRLDRGVGVVLDKLQKAGIADDTLVIFVSDNGIPFPGAKTTLYDAGVHLPLIIFSPKQSLHGKPIEAMASWVDITPTILDYAGRKHEDLQGRSLLPLLDVEKTPPGWDVVYGSHVQHEVTMYYPMRSIRTRTHKYILNLASELEFPTAGDLYGSRTWQAILRRDDKMLGQRDRASFVHRPREELYDLDKDPDEFHNVASDTAYAQVLGELRKQLKVWQEKTRDPWFVKYEHE